MVLIGTLLLAAARGASDCHLNQLRAVLLNVSEHCLLADLCTCRLSHSKEEEDAETWQALGELRRVESSPNLNMDMGLPKTFWRQGENYFTLSWCRSLPW